MDNSFLYIGGKTPKYILEKKHYKKARRKNSLKEGYYVWKTQKDNRVRSKHTKLNGKVFNWDDLPPGGKHPGEDYGCRCKAVPIDDELAYERLGKLEEVQTPKIKPEEENGEGIDEQFYHRVLTPPNPNREWLLADFARHYWFGGGKTITLEETGHIDRIIDNSRDHVYRGVERQVSDLARKKQSGHFYDTFNNSYSYTNASFIHGNSTIRGNFDGNIIKYETDYGYSLNITATVNYNFSDEFADLFNERQDAIGTSNPELADQELIDSTEYGEIFDIVGSWQTELTGVIKVSI